MMTWAPCPHGVRTRGKKMVVRENLVKQKLVKQEWWENPVKQTPVKQEWSLCDQAL